MTFRGAESAGKYRARIAICYLVISNAASKNPRPASANEQRKRSSWQFILTFRNTVDIVTPFTPTHQPRFTFDPLQFKPLR